MAAACHQLAGILLSVAVALAGLDLSACYVFKGSVTCLDCTHTHNHPADLSGVKVSVKCAGEKNMAMATTEEDGSFETTVVLPSSKSASASSVGCSAKIVGATRQLYVPMKASETKAVVVKAAGESDHSHYMMMTTSEPLRFYTKCPNAKCKGVGGIIVGGSKTVDLPLPREWGLPPTSYYSLPFIPIIGIP